MRDPQTKDEVVGQIRQLLVELFRNQGTVNTQFELVETRHAAYIALLEKRVTVLEQDLDTLRRNIHGGLAEGLADVLGDSRSKA